MYTSIINNCYNFSADRTRYECEVCDKILFGKKQWEVHLQTRKHRKMIYGKRKLELNEEQSHKLKKHA